MATRTVSTTRVVILATVSMLAFAGNSLLARAALQGGRIDAASFTTLRLVAGAAVLWLLVRLRHDAPAGRGNWLSALALFVYAAGFSLAYLQLPAASGALLLFGAVQATMIGRGVWLGERLRPLQTAGFVLALAGIVGMLLPGLSAPPLAGSLLMLSAGIAWGVYSLRGQGLGDSTRVTAGNFLRAAPIAVVLSLLWHRAASVDAAGVLLAVASGALASGIGYAVWYAALPRLKTTQAATVQLSVPVLTALGGVLLLGEPLTPRLVLASVAILGGILLVVQAPRSRAH
jgi:drug/metabolite transporter (DMT)-like permease